MSLFKQVFIFLLLAVFLSPSFAAVDGVTTSSCSSYSEADEKSDKKEEGEEDEEEPDCE